MQGVQGPYCHLWSARLYNIFVRISLEGLKKKYIYILREREREREHKMCFDFLYNFCLKHFSLYEEFSEILLQMYIGLHVKCPLLLSDFIGICIFVAYIPTVSKY